MVADAEFPTPGPRVEVSGTARLSGTPVGGRSTLNINPDGVQLDNQLNTGTGRTVATVDESGVHGPEPRLGSSILPPG